MRCIREDEIAKATVLDGWERRGIMPAMNPDDDQPKKLVRAMVILRLIGVVVAVVVLGASQRHHATFPDGSTVEILGMTVGSLD